MSRIQRTISTKIEFSFRNGNFAVTTKLQPQDVLDHVLLKLRKILCRKCRVEIFSFSLMNLGIPSVENDRPHLVKGYPQSQLNDSRKYGNAHIFVKRPFCEAGFMTIDFLQGSWIRDRDMIRSNADKFAMFFMLLGDSH